MSLSKAEKGYCLDAVLNARCILYMVILNVDIVVFSDFFYTLVLIKLYVRLYFCSFLPSHIVKL